MYLAPATEGILKREDSSDRYLHLLAEHLRLARRAKGWTQAELAERADVGHPVSVSTWETGTRRPSLAHAVRLAIELDVSLDWLVGLRREGGPVEP